MDAMPPAGVGEGESPFPAIPQYRQRMPPESDDTLATLRAQIDAVDARLLAAMAERIRIAQQVGAAKGAATGIGGTASDSVPVHRPGREAALIRALIARYDGPVKAAALHAVWRELIGASIAVQQPLAVATADSAAEQAARLHFGASQSYRWAASPVHDVAGDEADIALFPVGDGEAWQQAADLLAARPDCALLWRLPFTVPGGGWIAVGRGIAEDSGDDLTVAIADPAAVPEDPAIETLCALPDGLTVLAIDGELDGADAAVLQLGRFPAPLEI